MNLNRYFFGLAAFALLCIRCSAAEFPRGFFVEDLRKKPPVPAFYNLETHRVENFRFQHPYNQFIDMVWDHSRGRVFFSARTSIREPYRVYLKPWPDGAETVVYENPLGPFRFILSPDDKRLVIQVMGPSAWPILALHDLESARTILLGTGFSPDWAPDGRRLLFLQIRGNSLPTWLAEYDVDVATTTLLLQEPVAEAVYADSADRVILKTTRQAKSCDVFQVWDRKKDSFHFWSAVERRNKRSKRCVSERELNAFPGHQFFSFKVSEDASDLSNQALAITDSSGGVLQTIAHEDWSPKASAVEDTTLAIGEDPIVVLSGDGTGERIEIPQARFIRFQR